MTDRHAARELEIFRRFARAAKLGADEASLEKRDPPEPDLLVVVNGETVAFELVELIDEHYAQRTSGQMKLKAGLEASYRGLEPARRSRIEERAGNTLIHVVFEGEATFAARESAIDSILTWLEGLDRSFEGEVHRGAGVKLALPVRSIRVSRLSGHGPYFAVDSVGPLGDPTVDRIGGKLETAYATSHPVELLAYYELQPEQPESSWRPHLESAIANATLMQAFRRVWVYDCGAKAVRFVAPLPNGPNSACSRRCT